MTKDEQFAEAKKRILDKINSWEDAYTFFDELVAQMLERGQQPYEVVFLLYGFMHAMRELPDEGDIKTLVERMLYIIVYEGKEKIGADLVFINEKEALERVKRDAVTLAKALASDAIDTSWMDEPSSKFLH